jgi:hypothetical protein
MKKLVLALSLIVALASCSSSKTDPKPKLMARVYPMWYSSYDSKWYPHDYVHVQEVGEGIRKGDMISVNSYSKVLVDSVWRTKP